MPEGICMKCGATFAYDPFGPARQHVCAPDPETASKNKGAEDAGTEMTPQLACEGSGNAEAGAPIGPAFQPLPPKPRFDRKANHRRYMREWRARQTNP
jgi:hypothetical protein